jgi:hypothetical protein
MVHEGQSEGLLVIIDAQTTHDALDFLNRFIATKPSWEELQ